MAKVRIRARSLHALQTYQVRWYLGCIAAGVLAGVLAPQVFSHLEVLIAPVLGLLLFVTFLQVPMGGLLAALRSGRFLLLLGVLNFVVVPLVVGLLFRFVPDNLGVQAGVLLVLLCPCVDYVIVFSGLAGGDRERLLAATPVLLVAQLVLLPAYLWLFLGSELVQAVRVAPFLWAFAGLIVVPLVAAWVVQSAASGGWFRQASSLRSSAAQPPIGEPPSRESPSREPRSTEPPSTEPRSTEPRSTEPPSRESPSREPPPTDPSPTELSTEHQSTRQPSTERPSTERPSRGEQPSMGAQPSEGARASLGETIARLARGMDRVGAAAMVPLMGLVLFVVVASQVPRLESAVVDRAGIGPALVGIYVAFIALMTLCGVAAGRFSRLPVDQQRSVVFSGVTRNSLVVLPLALALPGVLGATAAATVVLQTLVELIGMVILTRLVPRLVR